MGIKNMAGTPGNPFNPQSEGVFEMSGTEGTFEYQVLLVTPNGRLGVRPLSNGAHRIRVEPTGAQLLPAFASVVGWKTPGSQPRYSIVTNSVAALDSAIALGKSAIA